MHPSSSEPELAGIGDETFHHCAASLAELAALRPPGASDVAPVTVRSEEV